MLSFFSQQFPDPAKAYIFVEDFTELYALTANLPVVATSPWLGTAAPGAGGTFSQTAATKGGVGVITTPATDNVGVQLQGDLAVWSLVAGKTTIGYWKGKMSDIAQSDFFAGVATIGSIHDGATLQPVNLFGISKADGESVFKFVSRAASGAISSTQIGGPAPASDTEIVVEFRITMDANTAGLGVIDFMVNGVIAGTATFSGMPSAVLAHAIAGVSGEAAAKTFTTDRFMLAQEI